ncbi:MULTISPECIES: arsenate reductase/protein-tyrosine-phosphatase family protein [Dietzia]|uniref:arsenate reductase/protein-tyrosine-phosphatase family protein n=1 Tax=Dietzia TaxID=37914 RepID=UPI0007848897|nr:MULTISPECIES: protein-tyrosine-phosphatase [Dietzia]KZO58293.1 protein-tyrosine-phosphatase [Dietzia maris]MCT2275429.1 protein-tyrosine-phosphatase [Dietzia cinnamea]
MALSVMTVCTGNMCRSPLAERLLAARTAAAGLDVTVDSAGTRAANGAEIHRETLRVLQGYGGEGDGFASRLLTTNLLAGRDLVLTATRAHRDAVQELAPLLWKKTYTLLEAAQLADSDESVTLAGLSRARLNINTDDPALDVEDPIGREAEVFDRTGAQISDAVDSIVRLLARS